METHKHPQIPNWRKLSKEHKGDAKYNEKQQPVEGDVHQGLSTPVRGGEEARQAHLGANFILEKRKRKT